MPAPRLENKFRERGIKAEFNAKGFIVIPPKVSKADLELVKV